MSSHAAVDLMCKEKGSGILLLIWNSRQVTVMAYDNLSNLLKKPPMFNWTNHGQTPVAGYICA